MIPRWPNGATRRVVRPVISQQGERRTKGTETSQYLEEEKSLEMPSVAASERGSRLNRGSLNLGVVGSTDGPWSSESKCPGMGRQRRGEPGRGRHGLGAR